MTKRRRDSTSSDDDLTQPYPPTPAKRQKTLTPPTQRFGSGRSAFRPCPPPPPGPTPSGECTWLDPGHPAEQQLEAALLDVRGQAKAEWARRAEVSRWVHGVVALDSSRWD
jgi:hypothetical protein